MFAVPLVVTALVNPVWTVRASVPVARRTAMSAFCRHLNLPSAGYYTKSPSSRIAAQRGRPPYSYARRSRLAIVFADGVGVNSIALDRNGSGGWGGIDLCELIIYTGATNTLADANAIHTWLLAKWKGAERRSALPATMGSPGTSKKSCATSEKS